MVTAFKLALRSIRTSKARYLSLFFIVLLSVGFYAGLKLCRPQFWQACRNYLTDQHFYDFRIFSDLGFDKDDVKAFEDLTGVSLAEGEKSLDAMADIGGTTSPVTVMALPQSVNVPSVVSGRLPESDDECVVDHRALPDSAIGETITMDSEDLKETTLTVVGTVNSPLYLNADRGSTSLGNGSLSGFVYVTRDNFTTDYDTAIDLVFSDSASYDVFSDAYDDYIADNNIAKKIAVIYDNSDAYSSGIFNTFKSEAKEKGLDIVAEQSFTKDSKTDFSAQISAAKSAEAELLFLPIYYQEASLILAQCKSADFSPKFFGCDGLDGILSVDNFDKSLAEGVMLLTPFAADASDDATQKFVKAYKEKYKDETPNQFAADAYDGVKIIAKLVEKESIKGNMSKSEICDKLKKAITDGFTYDGLTGQGMTWSAEGAVSKNPKAVVIKDGNYSAL